MDAASAGRFACRRLWGYAVGVGAHLLIGEPSSPVGRMPEGKAADQRSTTGTTPDDVFVGRVAGDDPGYLATGTDKRAEPDDEPGGDGRASG
ncbi:hypothetical protein ACQEV2_38545 [Streptomyces sp. CA-251387]|uniref:hypothetical protein n=1 Tax=Streptomyces sp. CA-251387 TaxID=3240064 RepID=UPI003D91C47B